MLTLINFIITILYQYFIIKQFKKIPESISETSYLLGTKNYIFSIYCIITALLLFYPWITCTYITYQFLCFLGCSGVLFAGLTPLFREGVQKYIHYAAGGIAFISGVIWLILSQYYLFIFIDIILFILLTLIRKKSFVYWAEIIFLLTLLLCI